MLDACSDIEVLQPCRLARTDAGGRSDAPGGSCGSPPHLPATPRQKHSAGSGEGLSCSCTKIAQRTEQTCPFSNPQCKTRRLVIPGTGTLKYLIHRPFPRFWRGRQMRLPRPIPSPIFAMRSAKYPDLCGDHCSTRFYTFFVSTHS